MSEPDDAVDGGIPARIAESVVGRAGAVITVVLALALLGLTAATRIPMDAVPDITNVQVLILTRAPGLGPVQVEALVTHPVEIGTAGIPGLHDVRSISRAGLSAVTLVFDDDVDPLLARLQVSERLPTIASDLPSAAEAPELGPFTTGLGEVFHFTVRWPGHTPEEIFTLVDWEIAHHLRRVPGVVEVNTWGGSEKQYQVRLDPARMASRNVTLAMVADALRASNRAVGAGSIERDGAGVVVQGSGLLETVDEIGRVTVRRANGAAVRVRDVAEATIGGALRAGVATGDARGELVYVMAQMVAGGNARITVAAIRERLDEIRAQLPPGVQVETFYDRAAFVHRVITTVGRNLLEGAVLVVAVLFLALGDLGAGLAVALLIPLAAAIGAVALQRIGVTGNLMSLGAVDFGLVVDGGIVVVEHAMSAARHAPTTNARALARASVRDVARPMAYGVAIIAMVYVPVLALEGVEGRMFRPMAIVVLCVLGAALALSLTLVPALTPWLVRRTQRRGAFPDPWLVRTALCVYRPALAFALQRPWAIGAMGMVALVAGAWLGLRAGSEFMPRLDEGSLAVQLTRPPSTSIDEGARGATIVEETLVRFPEVERVVSRTGSPAVATDVMGPEQSDVFVMLRDRATWRRPYDREALVDEMDAALRRALPGCEFSFTQPIEMRMSELLSGIRSDVGVRIFGEDLDVLRELGARVAEVLRSARGGVDVRVEQVGGLPTLAVRPDRDALARYDLRSSDVLDYVQALRAGVPIGRIYEGERHFDLVVRAGTSDAPSIASLPWLPVAIGDGTSVPLRSIATLDEAIGPAQVSHERGERRLVVEANVRGRDLASYVQEVQSRLARDVHPPRGYTLDVGGQYQNLSRAARRLAIVIPLVLVAIFVMLRAALGRWSSAALVFLNVPAAASGGLLALGARGMALSITAGVGFIALAGIAVLNGLVLLTDIDHRRAQGVEPRDAAREGALSRLRPVLTTALVAALGFVPMALARGTGAEVQRPLATVIIGGLVTATFATLLLLPSLAARATPHAPIADDTTT